MEGSQMKVSVIPARIQRPDRHDSGTETARTRVAAYCRVSTDRDCLLIR